MTLQVGLEGYALCQALTNGSDSLHKARGTQYFFKLLFQTAACSLPAHLCRNKSDQIYDKKILIYFNDIEKLNQNQWRIQDFPEGGANSQSGCANLFFAENCMKMKEFGPRWGRPRHPSP